MDEKAAWFFITVLIVAKRPELQQTKRVQVRVLWGKEVGVFLKRGCLASLVGPCDGLETPLALLQARSVAA